MPLYAVGFLGMTRRMQHYDVAEWRPWLLVAAGGAVLILIGIIFQIAQLVVSHPSSRGIARSHRRSLGRTLAGMGHRLAAAGLQFRGDARRQRRRCLLGDEAARRGSRSFEQSGPDYRDVEMPRNSPTGFVCAFFATIMGFALIWHIWWMVAAGGGRRVCDLRRVRLARPRRIRHPGRGGRAHRPRQSGTATRRAEPRGERLMSRYHIGLRPRRPKSTARALDASGTAHSGPASKRIVTGYGFWIFLLSDIVMFSCVLCDLCRAARADGGRPARLASCSTCATSRSRPASC